MASLSFGVPACRFKPSSSIWRAVKRLTNSWKDFLQFRVPLHWKRLKKPALCYRHIADAAFDRRVYRSAAGFARLAGLKKWPSADAAEAAGLAVLTTTDQSIPDQQNLSGRMI